MHKKRLSFLDLLEKAGNFLPHPVILFILLILLLIISSAIAQFFGLSIADPRKEGEKIVIINLLNMQEFVRFTTHMITNFTNFPPLGTALIAMLGVGIAEASGFLSTAIRTLVLSSPKKLITPIVVFSGIMSNLVSDFGYVVLIPLAAMIFHSLGRHPLAGIAAAFAGVSGGFSANLLIGTLDPIISGITQQAARIINPNYIVGVEANWYFMMASTFLITFLGYIVTEKIVEPRLGKYISEGQEEDKIVKLTPLEKKALFYAFLGILGYIILIALLILPQDSLFRNPKTGSLIGSPFFQGIIFFVFFFFAIPGAIYGIYTQSIKSATDIAEVMASAMRMMAMYLVIIFFASQFIKLFEWSNFGPFLAIQGANFLKSIDLNPALLLIGFVLVSASINLFICSASAQWALIAPIFVPMLMLLGYSPEVIQAAYRIGDSATNLITPLLAYLPIILAVAMRYKKDTKIGTMISMMFPYTIVFLIGWCALLYLWVFVLELPVGPGSALIYGVNS
ncbi:aminobenzoyl-glutamate transporter [Helicobacter cholecystus]|uniref:Aminobenzoyl-glutamate transporter n=1 Tax=Helicobacter cholecystus TaxID=45498 RepID=A0A3D8ITZ1_9HELI|nr:AbgT family transporter [Helicobacter cholecystus]RDU68692.1 aminobenzoyl-glutamate transporter [Helicobacter cholecystus]VEJ26137.1 Short chain fattyacids transporter [Helicobacter cholecystus]